MLYLVSFHSKFMIRFTKDNYKVSGSSIKENQRLIEITKNSTIVFNSIARGRLFAHVQIMQIDHTKSEILRKE